VKKFLKLSLIILFNFNIVAMYLPLHLQQQKVAEIRDLVEREDLENAQNQIMLLRRLDNLRVDRELEDLENLIVKILSDYQSESVDNEVLICHSVGRGGNIQDVLRNGLMTYNELFRRGLSKEEPPRNCGLLCDQYDVIYFDYSPRVTKENCPAGSVCIAVDPHATYVYNREFRFDANYTRYQMSRVLLADYMKRRRKADRMRHASKPGQVVVFDPFTAEPFYVAGTDPRARDLSIGPFGSFILPGQIEHRHYLYHNEVIISRNNIPREEFVCYKEREK